MSDLEPRIVGTEWESAITLQREDGKWSQIKDTEPFTMIERHMPAYLFRGDHELSKLNHFMSNGSRIYKDINDHIEYSTPEDDSFWGVTANEIAAETVLLDMVQSYSSAKAVDFRLNKRVIDSHGITWGYHENYFMPRVTILPSGTRAGLLLAHLATRGVFCGAGYIDKFGKYRVAQKMVTIENDIYHSTTTAKPLLNTRNEPLTDKDKYIGQRLHVTSGDVNMSPWATFLKLATTSVVIRLFERGIQTPESILPATNYASIVPIFNTDPSLKATAVMYDGKSRSALDIQNILWEQAQQLQSECELPAEEQQAISMWREILDDLATPDKKLATERLDWVLKGQAIARFAGKHGLSLTDEKIQGLDWRWDTISEDGVGIALRKTRWQEWVDEALIKERITNAPTTTRAHVRAAFVGGILASDRTVRVNWDRVAKNGTPISLPDPRNNDIEQLAA